jgi:hypothetical protein
VGDDADESSADDACEDEQSSGGPSLLAVSRMGWHGEMARAGIEPATPRFSAVCSTD